MKELKEKLQKKLEQKLIQKYDKEQPWIYLVYKGTLKSGKLAIAEPDKCLGYERYKIGEVDERELSNGAKELIKL